MSDNFTLHERLKTITPLIAGDFIYSLIYPEEKHKNVHELLDFIFLKCAAYFFCTMELSGFQAENDLSVYSQLHTILSDYADCVIGPQMINRVIVFFPFFSDSESKNYESFIKKLYALLSRKISGGVRMGVSSVCTDFGKSVQIYTQSIVALSVISEKGCGLVFYSENNEQNKIYLKELDCIRGMLFSRIKAGDRQSVTNLFDSFCRKLLEYYEGNLMTVKNQLFELLVVIRQKTHECDQTFGQYGAFCDTFSSFCEIKNPKDLKKYVLSCIIECVQVFETAKDIDYPPQIKKLRAYVSSHISENTSLEDAAAVVHMHPVYLSKIFREITGENFIDFETSVRIDKAKELLGKTLMSVKEITYSVGYSDQNYFSKLFKKNTGQTPTEYRQSVTLPSV